MTFLAPSSDRTVRKAVEAYLRDGSVTPQPAQATFETRNSRYVVSDGTLVAALDDSIVGAEFVGWLIESEGYATVLPVWQEGARAILVDARRHRQIVVTSTTRSYQVEEPRRTSGSGALHPGSPGLQSATPRIGIPPCPPPPPRLAGMSAAPSATPRPLVTIGSPEPSPPPARVPRLRPSTPPVAEPSPALLDADDAAALEPPPSSRAPSSVQRASVPPRAPARPSAPPRPLPYPTPPPRRSGPIAPVVSIQDVAPKTTFDGIPLVEITLEEDLAEAQLTDAPDDESTDDESERAVTGRHRTYRERRVPPPPGPLATGNSRPIPPPPKTNPYGFSTPG